MMRELTLLHKTTQYGLLKMLLGHQWNSVLTFNLLQ